jgi:hypothetical protein
LFVVGVELKQAEGMSVPLYSSKQDEQCIDAFVSYGGRDYVARIEHCRAFRKKAVRLCKIDIRRQAVSYC